MKAVAVFKCRSRIMALLVSRMVYKLGAVPGPHAVHQAVEMLVLPAGGR